MSLNTLDYQLAKSGGITRIGKIFIAVMLIVLLEGAARKWISGALTIPLIGLRDLLVIYAVTYAIRRGLIRWRSPLGAIFLAWSCLVVAWALFQAVILQFSPLLTVVGLRFWLLYYWFAYVCAATMTRDDFLRATFILLWFIILSLPLVILQQMSPPGAFINSTPDTDEQDIFIVVSGVVRATATFTFTLGYTTLLAIVLPVLLTLPTIRGTSFKVRFVFFLSFGATLIGVFLSGSRGAIVTYGATIVAYLLGTLWFSKGSRKLSALVLLFALAILGALAATIFAGALEANLTRFQNASEAEDLTSRLLVIFTGGSEPYKNFDWLGAGLGMGSNLAGYFQSGSRSFLLAEDEPARILLEAGLLGVIFLILKAFAIVATIAVSIRATQRSQSAAALTMGFVLVLALLSWPALGQLTVNAMLGILVTFALLCFRFNFALIDKRIIVEQSGKFSSRSHPNSALQY